MKVTKAQAQENRARIVETASKLFRERGYDGVGVADLMGAAGFTHGGFYKHFGSKADLMAESSAWGLKRTSALAADMKVSEFVNRYISREHRDAVGEGCTLAALCGDAARQPAFFLRVCHVSFSIGVLSFRLQLPRARCLWAVC